MNFYLLFENKTSLSCIPSIVYFANLKNKPRLSVKLVFTV